MATPPHHTDDDPGRAAAPTGTGDTGPDHHRDQPPRGDHDDHTVVVVTGGDEPAGAHLDAVLRALPPTAEVVSADSGLAHAVALGLTVGHAVGDFDSVDPALLEAAVGAGARVVRHPVAKDATDLEIALDTAEALGARRVVVLGGHGGRLDHFLANCLALAAPRYANLVVEAVVGEALVQVARPWAPTVVQGEPGELVTLLPAHGPAEGVTTEGLLYPLRLETLLEGSTRGVSNELARPVAEVRLTAGALLVVRPGGHGTHLATGTATPRAEDRP